MNVIEHLASGLIPPEPVINITDPVLFNVCMAALAKDDVRYYLNHLLINPEDNSVTGCNGHMLVTGHAVDCSALRGKKPLLILPKRRLPKSVHFAEINLHKHAITGLAKERFVIPFDIAQAKYPSFSRIVHDVENIETNKFSFQPKYLHKLSKAALTYYSTLTAHQGKKEDGSRGNLFYKVDFHSRHIKSDYTAIIVSMRI